MFFNEATNTIITFCVIIIVLFSLSAQFGSDAADKLTDDRYEEKTLLLVFAESPFLVLFAVISYISVYHPAAASLIAPVSVIWLFRTILIFQVCKKIKYSKLKFWIVQIFTASLSIAAPQVFCSLTGSAGG